MEAEETCELESGTHGWVSRQYARRSGPDRPNNANGGWYVQGYPDERPTAMMLKQDAGVGGRLRHREAPRHKLCLQQQWQEFCNDGFCPGYSGERAEAARATVISALGYFKAVKSW